MIRKTENCSKIFPSYRSSNKYPIYYKSSVLISFVLRNIMLNFDGIWFVLSQLPVEPQWSGMVRIAPGSKRLLFRSVGSAGEQHGADSLASPRFWGHPDATTPATAATHVRDRANCHPHPLATRSHWRSGQGICPRHVWMLLPGRERLYGRSSPRRFFELATF